MSQQGIENRRTRWHWLLGTTLVIGALGCGEQKVPRARERGEQSNRGSSSDAGTGATAQKAAEPAAVAVTGWGTIKGRIVWGTDIPVQADLGAEKDKDHCLAKGAIKEEAVVVDATNRGLRDVFVYLRSPAAVHPDLPKDAAAAQAKFNKDFEAIAKVKPSDAEGLGKLLSDPAGRATLIANLTKGGLPVIDQLFCKYVPHAVAAQQGQKVLVLNYEPISHNVKVASTSGKNDANPTMPPNTVQFFDWTSENTAMTIECGIHPWMKMSAMAFNHPYFVVTGTDGSFELKNVPATEVQLVLRHKSFIDPVKGGKGTTGGAKITVKAGETVDLKEIKYSGE